MRLTPRYRTGDRIGGRFFVHKALLGGMGEVYLCLDLKERIPLALKTFQARFLTSQRLRDAFKAEVKTWVDLGAHPNIVRCHVMDIIDSQPFMFLEWISDEEGRGNDLRDWLRDGPLPTRLSLQFAIDISRGLAHAGEKQPGIVHRDIKPDNVLVAIDQVALVTDWGLAKLVQETNLRVPSEAEAGRSRQSLVAVGVVVGTPPYMAPEQWLNEPLDARTDIYALGCVLYEMLAGELPYRASSFEDFRLRHLTATVPSLPVGDETHRHLNRLIARCMAKRKDERAPTFRALLEDLTRIYEQQFGEPPRAIRHEDENAAIELYYRAMTYHNLELYEEALTDFAHVIRLDPDNGKVHTVLGNTYFRLGRFDEALAEHDRSLELDPLDFKAYSNRGNTLAEMGRYDEALADFARSIDLAPTNSSSLINRGTTYKQMGRYDEALADYTRAIRNNPREVMAYVSRGSAYMETCRYEEALADAALALRLDPGCAPAYQLRAKVNANLGLLDAAESDLKRATDFGLADPETYLVLANLLVAQGKGTEVEQCLRQAVRRCGRERLIRCINQPIPEQEDASGAWCLRGMMLASIGEAEEAIRCFDKSIGLDPQSFNPVLNKGTTLYQLKRYDEALEYFDRAIAMRPDYVLTWHNKGNTFGMMGRYREALECFQQAVHLDPSYGPAQHGLMQAMTFLRREAAAPPAAEVGREVPHGSEASACPRCALTFSFEPFEPYRKMGVGGARLQCPRCGTVMLVDFESGKAIEEG